MTTPHEKDRTVATLVLVTEAPDLWLAENKVGYARGKLNAPGGKRRMNESVERCAIREADEEFGIRILIESLRKVAVIEFFAGNALDFHVHVFRTDTFSGTPSETEAMQQPERYPIDRLPYDRMLEADRHWMPLVLAHDGSAPLLLRVHYTDRMEQYRYLEILPATL